MLDRQFLKDPSYYCFGCHREGKMTGSDGKEKIRSCDICGLKFCHYCGHIDESSLSFLCKDCWKTRASRLVHLNKLDEATTIMEMLQDYDGLDDILKLKERMKDIEKTPHIEFERLILKENGVFSIATRVHGLTFTDTFISAKGKKGLVGEVGWKFGPVIWKIYQNFYDKLHLRGKFDLDPMTGKVKKLGHTRIIPNRECYLFQRIEIRTVVENQWATSIDSLILLDKELMGVNKKDLINIYGWDIISILIKIQKKKIKNTGHFIYDNKTGSVHLIGSLSKF